MTKEISDDLMKVGKFKHIDANFKYYEVWGPWERKLYQASYNAHGRYYMRWVYDTRVAS